jgi:hypothetical protein
MSIESVRERGATMSRAERRVIASEAIRTCSCLRNRDLIRLIQSARYDDRNAELPRA